MLLFELTLNSGCDYRPPSQVHHREEKSFSSTRNDSFHHSNFIIGPAAPLFMIHGWPVRRPWMVHRWPIHSFQLFCQSQIIKFIFPPISNNFRSKPPNIATTMLYP
jgi:hypothetical protein